ncbi:hypothetical protein BRC62_08115 [Halobacteriales archaeon QH_10_67_13]|nr:MAG: hypothetical protein BRC62_08115 [Halobacteriales archaeon QH_10_67_13]
MAAEIGPDSLDVTASGSGMTDGEGPGTLSLLLEAAYGPDAFGAEFDFDAVVPGQGDTQSAATSGEVAFSADRLTLETSVEGEAGTQSTGLVPGGFDQFSLTIEEGPDGYSAIGSAATTVPEAQYEQYRTPEAVERLIRGFFQAATSGSPVTATVDVTDHSFDEEAGEVSFAYAVGLEGVEEALVPALAAETDEAVDRGTLQEALEAATLAEFSVELSSEDDRVVLDTRLDVRDYEELTLALAEAGEDGDSARADLKNQFDAMAAADYEQRVTWDVSVGPEDGGQGVDINTAIETDNWGAYVDELDREIDTSVDAAAEFIAEDGLIEGQADLSVEREDWVRELFGLGDAAPVTDDEGPFGGLSAAGFEDGAVRIVGDSDTITAEAAVEFESFESLAEDSPFGEDLTVEQVAFERENPVRTYVYLDGEDRATTREALEDAGVIGPETTVTEPGEWDRDELPSYNSGQATELLATEVDPDAGAVGDDDGSGPGFGVAAALVAVLVAALVAARRD